MLVVQIIIYLFFYRKYDGNNPETLQVKIGNTIYTSDYGYSVGVNGFFDYEFTISGYIFTQGNTYDVYAT